MEKREHSEQGKRESRRALRVLMGVGRTLILALCGGESGKEVFLERLSATTCRDQSFGVNPLDLPDPPHT